MNTLSMEIFSGYCVYLPETGMGIVPMSKEQCFSFMMSNKDGEKEVPAQTDISKEVETDLAPQNEETGKHGQMKLF